MKEFMSGAVFIDILTYLYYYFKKQLPLEYVKYKRLWRYSIGEKN